MSAIRYLLDEHVDPALRAQLVRHEPDLVVWIISHYLVYTPAPTPAASA